MPPSTIPPPNANGTTSIVDKIQSIASSVTANAKTEGQNFLAIYFSHLTILEVISVIISAALFAGTIYIIMKTGWLAVRIERIQNVLLKTDISKKQVQNSWKNVEAHFFQGSENDLKVAIMDADKLLNEALRAAGIRGVQLGERLKSIKPEQLPNLNEVWQAHKLRNQIAHEPDFKLNRDLSERALAIYETALRHLGAFEEPILGKQSQPIQEAESTEEEGHH